MLLIEVPLIKVYIGFRKDQDAVQPIGSIGIVCTDSSYWIYKLEDAVLQ
jgi:hypothetical protein